MAISEEDRKTLSSVLWKISSAIERLAKKANVRLPEFDEEKGKIGGVYDLLNDFEHERYDR